jgi:hypothetical protein
MPSAVRKNMWSDGATCVWLKARRRIISSIEEESFLQLHDHGWIYVGRTASHEQLFFACNLGTADERE